MGSKDKLKRFAENETFACLLQPEASSVMGHDEARRLVLHDHPVAVHVELELLEELPLYANVERLACLWLQEFAVLRVA